ncbi:subtilisin-like protein [Anaeromyces robustus]|uniref:Subtilisin-like protein n=1 Tax=Anaeromyces robustus TaxID=1754192 RepID=A0A1Y1X881_9FUNG|nr:subtilisin-like protein [Anaeromyces robustus]|eukprot:ORX81945.1 subtilisin-like protein [Anaeromyces robustus]
MKCYLTYLIGLTLLFINIINAKGIKVPPKEEEEPINTNDKFYLIYINNPYGEYKIYSDENIQKREESQVFVENLVDEIQSLINKNINTYKNPEKLIEIKEEVSSTLKTRKRDLKNLNDYGLVYPISSVKDKVVLYAYLSDELSKKINKDIENIYGIFPNKASTSLQYVPYNKEEILAETGWKDLKVRENTDFHLSLISQGKYNRRLGKKYDNNYYYPSSSGKDINLVILDSSFNFNYTEFSNTHERTIKCAANVENGFASTEKIDYYCGKVTRLYHGETVSDVAAGLLHGTANLANVYGVSMAVNNEGEINDSDILAGIQFIYENLIEPHKTVINLSMSGITYEQSEFYHQYGKIIDAITEKGGIVVAAAGNSGYNLGNGGYGGYGGSYYSYPCQFKNVICIGGIDNEDEKNKYNIYVSHEDSNYGDGVDFYAPFLVKSDIMIEGKKTRILHQGTSFSSPIVAGMIATIMSEHPEIQFTKNKIYEILKENGQGLEVSHLYYQGRKGIMANNGKRIIYSDEEEEEEKKE